MFGSLRETRLVLVGAAFFLSGASALAYQVSWQRILALQTGVGLYSVSVIVAAFMFGLGVGSHRGGVWSARVSPATALRIFAACELGIAAFGAVSVWLYYDVLYGRAAWLYAEPWRGGLLHFLALALPTTLMGMSLPFLTRASVRAAAGATGTIAYLYGINTLGAAAGALGAPWIFVRHHGIRSAVSAAVVANLAAGLLALLLVWKDRSERGVILETPPPAPSPGRGGASTGSFATWLGLYALSGFVALSLEIVWFRILDAAVKSTAYTFGTLLAIYLLGSAVGSLAGIRLVRRVERPRRVFLLLQCLLVAYAVGAVALLVWLPHDAPGYTWYYELWGGRRSFNLGGAFHLDGVVHLYVVLPLLLFGPPTVLMGLSYPVLQRAVQDDPVTSGRKVGLLQAANIAGCVAGSLMVGLLALDHLGTPGTLRAIALLGLAFAALGMRGGGDRRPFAVAAAVLAVLAATFPSAHAFWTRLHGTASPEAIVAEDATGIAALIPGRDEDHPPTRWILWAGGRGHSALPFGGVHTVLGGLPAVLHRAPSEVAIIGLGSGDSAASAGCRRDIDQRLTVFELFASERTLLQRLAAHAQAPPRLGRFLADPRFDLRIEDGRNALRREARTYDIIEADALWPTHPYAGNLYSLEFFRLCASRLKPGGLLCTWAPTERVHATFARALPHVLAFSEGSILVGSHTPIAVDLPACRARLFNPSTVAYLGPDRVNAVWATLQKVTRVPIVDDERRINRDLFPRDEYNTPD